MASDSVVLGGSRYVASGFGLLTTAIAARLLGPTDYGIAAITIAYPSLLWSFVGTKSVSITTRYVAGFRAAGQNDKLTTLCKVGYGLDLLASALAFILIAITSWWVARVVFGMPETSWLMVLYAAFLPLVSLTGTSWAILSSWQKFRWLAAFEVLAQGIPLILVTWFLLAGFGVAGMILGTALGRAAIGVAMVWATTHTLSRNGMGFWWTARLGDVAGLRKELASFFGWNYLAVTLGGVVVEVPLMILGHLRGPEEAGFYRLAVSIVTVGSYLESSLGRVAYPALSARWAVGERERIPASLRRWTLTAGLPVSLLLVATTPLLPWAVAVVFGPAYQPAVPAAQLMVIAAAVSALFFWLSAFYYALGAVKFWTLGYALYSLFVTSSGWFAIQRWGFLGIACLVAVGKVAFTTLMLTMLTRVWGKR